ncbi:MAG: type II secretion system protein [Thermodesulfobacteriota bacterium]|nr:type II secretion system protein [Thermodesulfobacteriota bacterium]
MTNTHPGRKNGFSLLELLLTISIIGIITAFLIGISNSLKNMVKLKKTGNRMHEIAQAAKIYYQAHEKLPAPSGTEAPVDVSHLNMEQKYRLDGWGQYLVYNTIGNSAMTYLNGNVSLTANTMTDIRALQVDGRRVAGVIISYGPNQTADYTETGSNPIVYALSAGSDDIIVPIDVHQEAVKITLAELKILQSKVDALDSVVYQCTTPSHEPAVNCPISETQYCGCLTLDAIKSNIYSSCSAGSCTWDWSFAFSYFSQDEPVNAFIYCLYGLADNLIYDPWLNAYEWGDPNQLGFDTGNHRYHKFFSLGPDGCTDTLTGCATGTDADDIIS